MTTKKRTYLGIALLLAALLLSLVTGCEPRPITPTETHAPTESSTPTEPTEPTEPPTTVPQVTDPPETTGERVTLPEHGDNNMLPFIPIPPQGRHIQASRRIMRTNPTETTLDVTDEPTLIDNVEDFQTFLRERTTLWSFRPGELKSLQEQFDEHFFQRNVVISGAIGAHSGSTHVFVKDVMADDEHIIINFGIKTPDIGTTDMASWHYFIGVSKADAAGKTPLTNLKIKQGPRTGTLPGRIWADM